MHVVKIVIFIVSFFLSNAIAAEIDYDVLLDKLQNQQQQLELPLYLDGKLLGNIDVVLRGDNVQAVHAEALLSLLPLNTKTVDQLDALDVQETFSKAQLNAVKIDIVYDPIALRLVAEVPLARLGVSIISNNNRHVRSITRPEKYQYSFFLNTRYGYQNFDNESAVGRSVLEDHTIDMEAGLAFNGWLLENAGLWRYKNTESKGQWRRHYTRFVYDAIDLGARFNLGDLSYHVEGFQSFSPVLGLGFASNRQLVPESVGRPTGSESFFIESTSRVEVYVGNRLVRTLYLNRGNYEIRDLPGVSGVNDVRLEISNAQGEQRTFDYSFVFSKDLLAVGEHDYSYNIGTLRQHSSSGDHYGNKPILSAFHRYGVHRSVTLGANLQAKERHYLPGMSMQWASNAGILAAELAASYIPGKKTAAATLLQYSYQKRDLGQFNASWQFFEPDFYAPTALETSRKNTAKSRTLLHISKVIGNRLIANANYRYNTFYAETRRSKAWDVGVSAQLFRRLRIGVVASRRQFEGTWRDMGFRFDISWRTFQPDQFFDATYNSQQKRYNANYSNRYITGQHELRSRLSHERINATGATRTGGIARYQNHRVEASSSYEELHRQDGGRQTVSRVGFGGALVMANNHWAISQPVSSSFVVLATDTDLRGKSVGVNPRRGGGFQSKISRWSPAVISGFSPYYLQQVYIDADETDLGLASELYNFKVVSSYKAGASLHLKSDNKKIVTGHLVAKSSPLSFVTGEVTDKHTGVATLFFTDIDGQFLIEGISPGQYALTVFGQIHSPLSISVSDGGPREMVLPALNVKDP